MPTPKNARERGAVQGGAPPTGTHSLGRTGRPRQAVGSVSRQAPEGSVRTKAAVADCGKQSPFTARLDCISSRSARIDTLKSLTSPSGHPGDGAGKRYMLVRVTRSRPRCVQGGRAGMCAWLPRLGPRICAIPPDDEGRQRGQRVRGQAPEVGQPGCGKIWRDASDRPRRVAADKIRISPHHPS